MSSLGHNELTITPGPNTAACNGFYIRSTENTNTEWSQMHYCDVIMRTMASQIARFAIVYSTVHSGAYQRKHQSFASLAFMRGIHRWPVNSPHKWPVTRKMFPFYDVTMAQRDRAHDKIYKGLLFYFFFHIIWPYLHSVQRLKACLCNKCPKQPSTILVDYHILRMHNMHLTSWGRDKMLAIFRRHFETHFHENAWFSINISLKFKSPIDNVPELVQIIAWRPTGDKPLSEPMMVGFTYAYMRHSASMI